VSDSPQRGQAAVHTVVDSLAGALSADGSRPLVTFYDAATGERVELSVVTFDNWVAKIANLFADELGLDAGDRVAVHLPPHWQSTVLILGAWTAGLALDLSGGGADVTVVGPQPPPGADIASATVIACSLRPLGGPMLERLPDGWIDFAVDVPQQPDALIDRRPIDPAGDAAVLLTGPMTHQALLEQAVATAGELGLATGGRLITDANPCRPSGIVPALAAPLAVGGSVVIVANAAADQRAKIAEQEQAETALWLKG
jgi:uncharacterized protein (TIGR03089 family)